MVSLGSADTVGGGGDRERGWGGGSTFPKKNPRTQERTKSTLCLQVEFSTDLL